MSHSASSRPLRRILARNVRLLRHLNGWSQEVLAERAGLHRNYVSSLERARHDVCLGNLQKIASALEVPAYELLKEALVAMPQRIHPHVEERRASYVH